MSEIMLQTAEIAWQDADAYPRGTRMKILRDDGDARTILLELPPGFHLAAHSHTTGEQHYVLEGEYQSGTENCGPGTYRYIPPHTKHGDFSSREGAVVLVVWKG